MPRTKVVLYREDDGAVPFLEWFARLPEKAQDKCTVRIERLQAMGHELRRPESDYLRTGIYELRATVHNRHYRILYFFHGRTAAVLSHGVIKEREVPAREIEVAIQRKIQYESNPLLHTHEEV